MKNFTALFLLLTLPFWALSQTYNLSGIVTHDGAPVPNTTVYLTQIDSVAQGFAIQELETTTDENGAYSFTFQPQPEASLTISHLRTDMCSDQVWYVYFDMFENVFSKTKNLECDDNWLPEMVIHSNTIDIITKKWAFNVTVYGLNVASYSWQIEGQTYSSQAVQHTFTSPGLHDVLLTVVSEYGNTYTSMTTVDVQEITLQTGTITGTVSQNGVGVAGAEVIFTANSSIFSETYLETTTNETGYYAFTNTFYTDLITEGDTTLFSLTSNACDGIAATNTPFDPTNINFEIDLNCNLPNTYAAISIAAAPTDPLEMTWYYGAYTAVPMNAHTWYINGETLSGNPITYPFTNPGDYEITVTAQTATGNIYTASQTIAVGNPYAANCTAYFIHDAASSNASQAYFVNASLGSNLSYLWDFGDGNTSTEPYPIHTFAASDTTYNVCLTITGDNNCEDNYCMWVYSDGSGSELISSGLKDMSHVTKSGGYDFIVVPVLSANVGMREEKPVDLKIYPNPANDRVYLSANGHDKKGGFIYVSDVSGRVIAKTKVSRGELISISVSHFSAGVYFVQYRGEAISKTVKLMVE